MALRGRVGTRTDMIKERLERELEARRSLLDSGIVLNSVHFLVTLNIHDDTVKKVVFRLEAGHD